MAIRMDLPLSLYIHVPWCIKKCPYCDFNSHCKDSSGFSEDKYINALLSDITQKLPLIWGRSIKSIFIGGGTPSLFSPEAYDKLFSKLRSLLPFDSNLEITLEANPGAIEHGNFLGYKEVGINRISLGVQSFSSSQLKKLGRVHSVDDVYKAVSEIKSANIKSFNLDIMYGLPGQELSDAIKDVKFAIELEPSHFSWYQLTIEPNTVFYRKRPDLPKDIDIMNIERDCRELLLDNNYKRYEVSAYSKKGSECLHNVNYWSFGDYLGIGAGAHSKITDANLGIIKRYQQYKMPSKYMLADNKTSASNILSELDMIFEFFLNRFRMDREIRVSEFELATGLSFDLIEDKIKIAVDKGFINFDENIIRKTKLGYDFLDDLVSVFLVGTKK